MKPDPGAAEVVRRPRWLPGPPIWLAAYEDGKLYRRLFEATVYELRPKGVIEWIWVNEIVNCNSWQCGLRNGRGRCCNFLSPKVLGGQ